MESYKAGDFGIVYLADDEPLKIVRKGSVRITTSSGSAWVLRDVRHVPGLKRNLISVGQLDDDVYSVSFASKTWKVTKVLWLLLMGRKMAPCT